MNYRPTMSKLRQKQPFKESIREAPLSYAKVKTQSKTSPKLYSKHSIKNHKTLFPAQLKNIERYIYNYKKNN